MSWVMVGITAVGAGLGVGGALGGNKDAQTAGGLVGLFGAAGGMSEIGGGAGGGGLTNLFGMESAGGDPGAFDVLSMGGGAGDDDVPWRKIMTMGGLQGMGNMMGGQEQGPPQMVPGTSPPPPSPNPFASLVQPYQYYG